MHISVYILVIYTLVLSRICLQEYSIRFYYCSGGRMLIQINWVCAPSVEHF